MVTSDDEKIILSTGPGVGGWIAFGFLFLFAVGALAFAAVFGELLLETNDALGVGFIVLCIFFFLVVIGMIYAAYRRFFWLENHTLWRRGLFRDRSYKLTSVQLSIASARIGLLGMMGPLMPHLLISDGEGRPLKVWLCNRDASFAMLPREQLYALSDAIENGRSGDSEAMAVSTRLRNLAEGFSDR